MYKRIFTALIAAVLAVFLMFVLGPAAVGGDPSCHIVAHVD